MTPILPDRAGVGDHATGSRGDVIPPGRRDASHGSHHGLFFHGSPDFPVEFLRSPNAAARGIDAHQDRLDIIVLTKFLERLQGLLNVIDHASDFEHPNAIGTAEELEVRGHQPCEKDDDHYQEEAEEKQEKASHKLTHKLITRSYARFA